MLMSIIWIRPLALFAQSSTPSLVSVYSCYTPDPDVNRPTNIAVSLVYSFHQLSVLCTTVQLIAI